MADFDALRAGFRASASPRDDSHPSSADWERLVCGELKAEPRRRLLDHMLDCPECSDTYRALGILRSEATKFDEQVPNPQTAPTPFLRSRWISWTGVGALAVAATALFVVVLPLQRNRDAGVEPVVVVRSADEGAAVEPVAPVGEVRWRQGDDIVLAWKCGSLKGPFVVEVLDADGEPVWTGPDTDTTETVWPGDVVPGAGRYYWRVFAGGSSSSRDESPLVAFDLVNANPP